ncbi:helix-turn-helix domain-containing protein [Carboxylicivirga sp. RSCT41]|uniref:helix-turn-helix domain-containing protein n=1 Tax=Carboxylicivirga agarovorans TaxID=3417570 RepID=UPI003D336779
MEILSAIASINALIIAFLVSRKKEKSTSDYILIAWIINFSFHFAIPFCIENKVFIHDSYWGFLMGLFVVAHAPFIFVYTSSLTNPNFKVSFKYFYHFALILVFIATFIPYFSLAPEDRLKVVQQKESLTYHSLLPMLALLLTRVYFLTRTIIIIVKHQYEIKQSFSYEHKVNLEWIKLIAYLFFGIIVLSFVLYGLVSVHIISVFQMDYLLITANMLVFFYIAYSGYKQGSIQDISPTLVSEVIETKTEKKPLPVTSSDKPLYEGNYHPAIQELLKQMEKDKLYLEPELNIGNVANQLNIHAHQLSKLINTQLGKNFFEFVNAYRVEEFKKIAADPKNRHISILGLAMDAGFNSKATFNRIFKNSTGLTPSEFMKSF